MKKEALKSYRILIPGIIILFFTLPLVKLNPSNFFINPDLNTWAYPTVVIVLGVLYNILNIRKFFLADSLDRINSNIRNQLFLLCLPNKQISSTLIKKVSNDKVMHVFYHIIDNDNSLKSKLMDVYQNGLIWSSVADLIAISLIYSAIYLIDYLVIGNFINLIYCIAAAYISIVSTFILMPLITKKHIALSNDQLDYMSIYYQDEICKQLTSMIREK